MKTNNKMNDEPQSLIGKVFFNTDELPTTMIDKIFSDNLKIEDVKIDNLHLILNKSKEETELLFRNTISKIDGNIIEQLKYYYLPLEREEKLNQIIK